MRTGAPFPNATNRAASKQKRDAKEKDKQGRRKLAHPEEWLIIYANYRFHPPRLLIVPRRTHARARSRSSVCATEFLVACSKGGRMQREMTRKWMRGYRRRKRGREWWRAHSDALISPIKCMHEYDVDAVYDRCCKKKLSRVGDVCVRLKRATHRHGASCLRTLFPASERAHRLGSSPF